MSWRMYFSGFYIPIQVPQDKTRATGRTIGGTIMNHTRPGGWNTDEVKRLHFNLYLRWEYQQVHTLLSL